MHPASFRKRSEGPDLATVLGAELEEFMELDVDVGTHVLHAHCYRVRDLAGTGRAAIASDIAHDHGTISEPELSAVILADPHPLDETEGRRQPGDRLAHVGVDQDRDDR
jgi:hypothetical protein